MIKLFLFDSRKFMGFNSSVYKQIETTFINKFVQYFVFQMLKDFI